jgi:ribonuclease HI
MSVSAPHFLLFSESNRSDPEEGTPDGEWRFVLESIDGGDKLEANDVEPEMAGERLELLAVVRGLEALDQPSRVTLVTPSKYVSRGLRYGLGEWRENQWQWERFGRMVPVKNQDLWQRVDQAMHFHKVDCRTWRFDSAHDDGPRQPVAPENGVSTEKMALRWVGRLAGAGRKLLAKS